MDISEISSAVTVARQIHKHLQVSAETAFIFVHIYAGEGNKSLEMQPAA